MRGGDGSAKPASSAQEVQRLYRATCWPGQLSGAVRRSDLDLRSLTEGQNTSWQATEEAIRIKSSWMKVSFKAVAMGTERKAFEGRPLAGFRQWMGMGSREMVECSWSLGF